MHQTPLACIVELIVEKHTCSDRAKAHARAQTIKCCRNLINTYDLCTLVHHALHTEKKRGLRH